MADIRQPASSLPVITDKTLISTLMVIDKNNNPSLAAPALVSSSSGGASTLVLARNPTVADDGSKGVTVGQIALNSVTGRSFIARTIDTGAAEWEPYGAGRAIGYKDGSAYYPEGMKINGANPAVIQPSTAGRILFSLGTLAERVLINNLQIKVSTGVAGTLAQVAAYKISPTTKRPTGDPVLKTGDIDCAATGIKLAALVAAYTGQMGPLAWGMAVNQVSGSTFTALDPADGTAQQNWGAAAADMFGLLTGVLFNGTYGTWPTFTDTSVFATSYGNHPAINFIANTPS